MCPHRVPPCPDSRPIQSQRKPWCAQRHGDVESVETWALSTTNLPPIAILDAWGRGVGLPQCNAVIRVTLFSQMSMVETVVESPTRDVRNDKRAPPPIQGIEVIVPIRFSGTPGHLVAVRRQRGAVSFPTPLRFHPQRVLFRSCHRCLSMGTVPPIHRSRRPGRDRTEDRTLADRPASFTSVGLLSP